MTFQPPRPRPQAKGTKRIAMEAGISEDAAIDIAYNIAKRERANTPQPTPQPAPPNDLEGAAQELGIDLTGVRRDCPQCGQPMSGERRYYPSMRVSSLFCQNSLCAKRGE